MKVNNFLWNEILHINDVSAIDIILYLFNEYERSPNKQLFNSIFFLKTVGKATSNNAYITDKFKTMLRDFVFCDKLNSNEVVFEFKPKYIDFFSDENLKRNYTDIDVSVIFNLHSLHSKKLYIYFEMSKFKLNQRIIYTEISLKSFKTDLNILGYDLNGNFNLLLSRFFSDIKEIIPSYEFKISYKKQSRKIISLLCFFNEKPEIKIDDFEVKTEFIPEKKEPENFENEFIPTKIELQAPKIENVINYQPEIKKQVVNEFKSIDNNKELIEMDNSELENYFDAIEKAMNMKSIITDSEVKENIKTENITEQKKEVPKIEVKEEVKEENLSIPEQIFKVFSKDYQISLHRFENMKTIFDSKNKKAVLKFEENFNAEWARQNKVDKKYQKAIAFITNEIYNVEVK